MAPFPLFYALQPTPPNTRGYLYYHHVPNTPPASAELRFRVITPKDDDSDLSSGSDLLLPNSPRPWSCTLFRLAESKTYQPLWDFFCHRYLDDATARWIQKNARNESIARGGLQVLHYLEQPFVMDMRYSSIRLGIVTPFGTGRVVLERTVRQRLNGPNGHLMLRFERSSLPEHANSRVIVIRVLKVLPPVQGVEARVNASHDGIGFPLATVKEGDLLERGSSVYAINVAHSHKDLNFLLLDSEFKVKKTTPPLAHETNALS
ncbi:hypothetical protein H0H92_005473 [Tricholoma furcatifolium]|nr:hypothetical protein H0H92_005473 [Tricholoma furcatifolium]